MVDNFLKSSILHGQLTITLPDGSTHCYGEDRSCTCVPAAEEWKGLPVMRASMTVANTDVFYKIITRHDTGIAEAWMARDFDVDDLGGFLAVLTANAVNIETHRGLMGVLNWLGDKALRLAHLARPNTIEGSRQNISEHYDAGNAMYKLFLDPTMTYSGAIHREGDTLEDAQFRKLDALIRDAGIHAGSHVLEIGCGWGSCAIRAAQTTGCKWTGITVSQEQLVEAKQRVKAAGLCDQVTLLFCDYRDVPGVATFDAVVSCEMIEAVGHEHLPTYFDMVGRVLKPGGLFAMQVITMPDGRYESYCNSSDFIRAHIFPGGHLPSMSAMLACAGCAALNAVSVRDVGPDYAVTLRAWRAAWTARWPEIAALGYSDSFMRKYEFYFAYCEAPFDSGYLQNLQITWKKQQSTTTAPQLPAGRTATLAPAPRPPADDACLAAGETAPPIIVQAPLKAGRLNDPLTVALVGVYFVLVGVAIGQQPHPKCLWLAPIAFALCMFLFQAFKHASLFVPGFAHMPPWMQAWWTLDCVHLLFSAGLGASSFAVLLKAPASFSVWPQPPSSLSLLLVSVATGFFGFQLHGLLRHGIHQRCPKAVLHFTVLLFLFGVCAFKTEHSGLLAVTLPAELAAVPDLMQKMYKLLKRRQPPRLQTIKFALDCVLRVMLHAVIAMVVLLRPKMWSSTLYYVLACVGLLYISWMNYKSVSASPALTRMWPTASVLKH